MRLPAVCFHDLGQSRAFVLPGFRFRRGFWLISWLHSLATVIRKTAVQFGKAPVQYSFARTEGSMAIKITVNGQTHSLDVEPDTPLLWTIRETLGLTGTKFGCGISACGACTVSLNGRAVRSCQLPVSAAEGGEVTTIEGLAREGILHPVQQAWITYQVPQCGYCQSGMIMAVAAFLEQHPQPSDEDIDASITNICRCGTFARVRRAIHAITQR